MDKGFEACTTSVEAASQVDHKRRCLRAEVHFQFFLHAIYYLNLIPSAIANSPCVLSCRLRPRIPFQIVREP